MKKTTIIALIILLIAGLFVACDNETIVDDAFTPTIDITSETKTLIPGNKYKTVADTTIANRITIEGKGTVTIILTEGTTLTLEKGVNVTGDQELYIEGTGKLVATGDSKSAGIGGGENEDGGTIVIQGGNITANGGEGGAGIGGGKGGKSGTTIIQKQGGKEAPEVTTKGGIATAHGIGNGEGVSEKPKEIKLDGVGLEVSSDNDFWEDYDGDNPDQYMKTFVGAIITFNANGGTGVMAAQVVHAGQATTLKENTFTKAGMSFKGWNTKADGSGTAYTNGGSININADITLYAQWETAPSVYYITAETTSITSGRIWTIKENVENNNRITIEGTAETTILLPKDLTLTASKGITVSAGQTLIIDGDDTGKLIAGADLGEHDNVVSGIGGNGPGDLGGTIIIKGGNITATGGQYAPGIGGDDYPEDTSIAGTLKIEISGGYVKSSGGIDGSAPGLGGFKATITIDGGEVVAEGAATGAGIGGYGCDITINGGTITATGKKEGAGIGSNDDMYLADPHHNITITGGTITAIGGSYDGGAGAGIGGGNDGKGGTILISGGKVEATGGSTEYLYAGAGIGGGAGAPSGTIKISGGTITATGGSCNYENEPLYDEYYAGAAGIGGGCGASCETVEITGGTITATGGVNEYTGTDTEKADGIGGGLLNSGHGTLKLGDGFSLYHDDEDYPYAFGPMDDIVNRYNVMKVKATPSGNYITTSTTSITSGKTWTIKENVENTNRIAIEGTEETTILLPAGKSLTLSNGITVAEGQTLTITGDSTGELHATGSGGDAGIGGVNNSTCGTIIIVGGKIFATGGSSEGAGIGGGSGAVGGKITISGGEVEATGGAAGGAGIGGGKGAAGTSGTNKITISGGKVVATGGASGVGAAVLSGAGIGGGDAGAGGTIEISGTGTIVIAQGGAAGNSAGAGIGGGDEALGGTVNISGGNVTAIGGNSTNDVAAGAGIGCGDNGNSSSTIMAVNVIISGGTIEATGGANGGAGIGGGRNAFGGNVNITGGHVETNGGDGSGDDRAMGIGSGKGKSTDGPLNVGTLSMYGDDNNSTPTAYKGTGTIADNNRYRYMDVY